MNSRPPEPVTIARVDPDRAAFVARNQRGVQRDDQGRLRTTGWTHDNPDAIPRAT
ncbi:hypothetical protein ABZ816_00295 [Actinosynnema sp. NPDC047251]|uniref:hypothetical protein n=1 Tax=Saccharothrix espanaensis TaxID=103731 RepID=UPI0002D3E030|nr:hypothetical protein [Saccharothrix espanaensis]